MTTRRRFTDDSFKKEPWFKALCSALLDCKTEEEMGDFLRDVGTLSELQAWSERLEVAKQLAQGHSYREVAKNTGASTTTVTRVAKFIENGEGGYRKFLKVHRHHRMGVEMIPKIEPDPNLEQKNDSIQISPLQKYLQREQGK
jgi:TrpR-related protein YerC/YecD